jgi:hypothetical protein
MSRLELRAYKIKYFLSWPLLQLDKLFVFIFDCFALNDAKNDLRAPFLCTFLEYLVILIPISDFSVHISDQILDHNGP